MKQQIDVCWVPVVGQDFSRRPSDASCVWCTTYVLAVHSHATCISPRRKDAHLQRDAVDVGLGGASGGAAERPETLPSHAGSPLAHLAKRAWNARRRHLGYGLEKLLLASPGSLSRRELERGAPVRATSWGVAALGVPHVHGAGGGACCAP